MIFNQSPIVSNENNYSFLDKIVYFLEYAIAVIIGFVLYSFIIFYISGKMEGLGLIIFIFWLFSVLSFDIIAAQYVYRNSKKLKSLGVNIKNTPMVWAIVVFAYPFIGLSWYLACRRADYNKQISNISSNNEIATPSSSEQILK
ncbi:MAG: hypothetical protein JJE53_02165 [Candidatus Pacebacteria bacterium]|nr:hypothetical protein [Candidatus Paceibacterota bacterium]